MLVAVGSDGDFHRGDGQGIPMTRVHNCKGSFPVWAAHLGGVTPRCCSVETNMLITGRSDDVSSTVVPQSWQIARLC